MIILLRAYIHTGRHTTVSQHILDLEKLSEILNHRSSDPESADALPMSHPITQLMQDSQAEDTAEAEWLCGICLFVSLLNV